MGIKTVSKPYLVLCARISEKPPHHMGIKTRAWQGYFGSVYPLKNLPTTWGLRPADSLTKLWNLLSLKNLPTTWGLRPVSISIS